METERIAIIFSKLKLQVTLTQAKFSALRLPKTQLIAHWTVTRAEKHL